MALSPVPAGPTIKSILNSIDLDKDGRVSRDEMTKMVEASGIGGGFFGGIKVSMAVDDIMNRLDTSKDGFVTMDEGRAQLISRFTTGGVPALGVIPTAAGRWFDATDTDKDGSLEHDELTGPVKAELTREGETLVDQKTDPSTSIVTYLLTGDGNGKVTKDQVLSLAKDVDTQLHTPAPKPVI